MKLLMAINVSASSEKVGDLLMSKKWNNFVIYDTANDGGGTWMASHYYHTISKYNKVFNNCLEWCAGPGFIGYTLLEKQVVKKISFLEIADSPIENLKETSASLDNKNINIYQGNELNCIPKQQFDLIVGNPPHFLSNVSNQIHGLEQRIYMDPEWNIHKSFFQQVENYLTDDGIVLLIENSTGSDTELFEQQLEGTNLQVTNTFEFLAEIPLYYIEIRKK